MAPKKARVLTSRRGFSSILLLVLGAVFFLIVAAIAVYVQSENNQAINVARAASSGSRLDFMSQTIQADFYNNLLQNDLELGVADFLMNDGPHQIDPTKSFYENLGGLLENYLSSKASLVVYGDAGQVYATAYSSIPKVSCTPREVSGAMATFNVRETETGTLELSSMSVGQRIYCEDQEDESNLEIALIARGYRLQTRALVMFEKARQAILAAKASLDTTDGVYQLGSGWRLPQNEEGKNNVAQDWNGKVNLLSMLIPGMAGDSDGISVSPGSVKIKPPNGILYQSTDLSRFECYGDVKGADEGGRIQTCRPEDIVITLGKPKPAGENGLDLNLKPVTSNSALEVTIEYAGVAIKMSSDLIGKLIGKLIDQTLSTESFSSGYARYGSATIICNAFRGKPNSAVVSGTVFDKNPKYVPSGVTSLSFEFTSTSLSLDDSYIADTITCSDKQDIINRNLLNLLTNGGREQFSLTIELVDPQNRSRGAKPRDSDVQTLANRVQSNPMYANTGENKVVNLHAEIDGGGSSNARGSNPVNPGGATPVAPVSTTLANPSSSSSVPEWKKVGDALKAVNPTLALTETVNSLQTAAAEMASLGRTGDAAALSKTASAVCKMTGMLNWQSMGDMDKTLAALCGLSAIFNVTEGKVACNLAGLYQAVKSGSVQAAMAQLARLLGDADLNNAFLTAASVQAAIQTGRMEDVLMAASATARLAGEADASKYLAGAAAVVYNIEHGGDVMEAMAAMFATIGDRDMANFFMSLKGLYQAIENGDIRGVVHMAGQIAQSMGYSALAQFEGAVALGENVVNMFTNFDELLEACEGKVPWDLICLTPDAGGGMCEKNWGSCTFEAGLPSFDAKLLCNDLIFDLGFQLDCTCTYTCPNFPYFAAYPKTIRINLKEWMMLLNPEQYAGIFKSLPSALASGDLMGYCRLDP